MLRGIAVILVLAIGLFASILSPLYALWTYLWYALFRPEQWIWWNISTLRISFILGVVLLIRSFLSGEFPYVRHRLAVACILFWITGLIAQTNANRLDIGWLWLGFLARLILVTLLLARLSDDRRKFVWTMAVIAASLGFHTAKAGAALLISGATIRFAEGFAGAYRDTNGYALAAAMILPFIIFTAQNSSECFPFGKWIGRFFWLATPLTCLTVVGLFSRSGFLALIAVIMAFLFLQKRKIKVFIILGAMLFVSIPFIPLPSGYEDRIETIARPEDSSAIARLHFWRVAVDMSIANPQGVGLKNFESNYNKYDSLMGRHGSNRSVHNSHLQVLAENGFLGAILWVYMFYQSFRIALSIRRRSLNSALNIQDKHFLFTASNSILASMVAFVFGGSFIALSLNDLSWLTFGLLIALDRISESLKGSDNQATCQALP